MSKNILGNISIGDFVTAYGTGYWQLIEIKPKIAFDDYDSQSVQWKKGDNLGYWVSLKKAFTDKMKPRIYLSAFPWDMNSSFDLLYSEWNLKKES